MNRDIRKSISDYRELFGNSRDLWVNFYPSDFQQIIDISGTDRTDLIYNGLMAGFMIGYHAAERKQRTKDNRNTPGGDEHFRG